jgi:hypothetical protein
MPVAVALPDEVAALVSDEAGGFDHAVMEAVVWQQYQRGRVSAGRAAILLGLSRADFEAARIDLGICLPFSEEELLHDLAWAEKRAANPEF